MILLNANDLIIVSCPLIISDQRPYGIISTANHIKCSLVWFLLFFTNTRMIKLWHYYILQSASLARRDISDVPHSQQFVRRIGNTACPLLLDKQHPCHPWDRRFLTVKWSTFTVIVLQIRFSVILVGEEWIRFIILSRKTGDNLLNADAEKDGCCVNWKINRNSLLYQR